MTESGQVTQQVDDRTDTLRYVWLLVAVLVLVDIVAATVFVAAPSSSTVRGYFINEDSLVENLTAGMYLGTFSLALLLLADRRVRNRKSRRWLGTLSFLGLIAFLDEISFGERLFDLDMPVLGDVKIDAVHDLIDVVLSQAERLEGAQAQLVLLALLIGLVLFAVVILKHGNRIRESIITDRYFPLYLVALIVVLLGCAALALDTERFRFRGANALEECFELNVALALFASCLIVRTIEIRTPASQRRGVAD